MKHIILILLSIALIVSLNAQETVKESNLDADLLFYGDVMINGTIPSTRVRAGKHFEKLFNAYLQTTQPFTTESKFHDFISILEAPDNSFKLVTWLIKGDQEEYDFKGYIVRNDGNHIELKRAGQITEDLVYSFSSDKEWYGSLYYKIMKGPSKKSYMLFGYDPNGLYDNKKIVDHMTIDGNSITFGKEIFEDKDNRETYMNRLVLRYSSDASVNLNYNPDLNMIVHDHLEQVMGLQAGQGPTQIPDGTYEGYYLKKGKWMYKEKLFDHVYNEAPRPKPVFKATPPQEKSK